MKIQDTDWYKARPEIIRNVIDKFDPSKLYRFKDSHKQFIIQSYEEPESGLEEDVTFTVCKTGKGGALETIGFPNLDIGQKVFEVRQEDIEPVLYFKRVNKPEILDPYDHNVEFIHYNNNEITKEDLRNIIMEVILGV